MAADSRTLNSPAAQAPLQFRKFVRNHDRGHDGKPRVADLTEGFAKLGNALVQFAPQPCEESPVGPTIAVLGVAAYAAGTIDDILTAPGRAARMNRAAATRVTLAPQLAPGRAGVAVVGTF